MVRKSKRYRYLEKNRVHRKDLEEFSREYEQWDRRLKLGLMAFGAGFLLVLTVMGLLCAKLMGVL